MASWWFAKADSEQNFTNTTYNEKHTLDFTAPAQGDYLILVSFEGITNSTSGDLYFRAQLDDTITILEGQARTEDTYWGDYHNHSTVYLAENLGSGSHSVDVDAYVSSGDTGYLRYIKIVVLRLDDWLPTTGMYAYAATEGESSLTSSFATYETLTFTPDTSGDYLILASCELQAASTTKTIHARINYDAGSEYLPVEQSEESPVSYIAYEGEDTSEYRPVVWGGIVTLPASSKTFLLESYQDTGGGAIRRRRLIAIRLAAMDSTVESTEDATNTSTTATWADKSTLTFTPSSTSDYLILGGMVIKPDDVSYPGHVRINHTVGTSPAAFNETEYDSRDADNPADCLPTFTCEIKSLGATSQTFKTQYGDIPTGGTQYGKGSFLIAIRKPAAALDGESITSASTRIALISESVKSASTRIKLLSESIKFASTRIAYISESVKTASTRVALVNESIVTASTRIKHLAESVKSASTRIKLFSESITTASTRVAFVSESIKSASTQIALISESVIAASTRVSLAATDGESIVAASTRIALINESIKVASTRIKVQSESIVPASTRIKIPSESIKSASTRVALQSESVIAASTRISIGVLNGESIIFGSTRIKFSFGFTQKAQPFSRDPKTFSQNPPIFRRN